MSEKDLHSTDNKAKKEVNSSNIFDEFGEDATLAAEVEKLKEANKRDLYYYLSAVSKLLQTIFVIGIIFLTLAFAYIYVQNDDKFANNELLNPICYLFVGDLQNNLDVCSSITVLDNKFNAELINLKNTQTNKIVGVLTQLYKNINFTKTKDVSFLLSKSTNNLKVLDIITKFDSLKLTFNKVDKEKIQCFNFNIDANKKYLKMSCEAYTEGYENKLIGFDGQISNLNITGTSISLANSFLNYIEKNSEEFELIDRQKLFKKDNISGERNGLTNKTTFNLILKYKF